MARSGVGGDSVSTPSVSLWISYDLNSMFKITLKKLLFEKVHETSRSSLFSSIQHSKQYASVGETFVKAGVTFNRNIYLITLTQNTESVLKHLLSWFLTGRRICSQPFSNPTIWQVIHVKYTAEKNILCSWEVI